MYLWILLCYFAIPAVFDILICPNVFEGSTFGWRTDRSFVLFLGIEGWIEINQIYAVGVYPAHNVKIIGK